MAIKYDERDPRSRELRAAFLRNPDRTAEAEEAAAKAKRSGAR